MKSTTKIFQSLVLLLLYRSWQGRDSWWTGSDIQRHKLRWSHWSWDDLIEVEVASVKLKLSCRNCHVESEVILLKVKLYCQKWSWVFESEVEVLKMKLSFQKWNCVVKIEVVLLESEVVRRTWSGMLLAKLKLLEQDCEVKFGVWKLKYFCPPVTEILLTSCVMTLTCVGVLSCTSSCCI